MRTRISSYPKSRSGAFFIECRNIMKIEAQFISRQNVLFSLDEKECSLKDCSIIKASPGNLPSALEKTFSILQIDWSDIGKDEGSYNEAFLADLREFLKSQEEQKRYAIIEPITKDAIKQGSNESISLIASAKHCARRIKDCTSVIGFVVPAQCAAQDFIDELKQKHGHYIFFSNSNGTLQDSSIVKLE